MTAKVVGVNYSLGRAVAFTELGEYVLLELLDDGIELHDVVSADFDLHPLASEFIKNTTTNITIEVFIQDYCNKNIAQNYLNGN